MDKKISAPDKKLLVRVAVYDNLSCADFEYITISELITKLENNEIQLKPEDLETFIYLD